MDLIEIEVFLCTKGPFQLKDGAFLALVRDLVSFSGPLMEILYPCIDW